MDSLVLQTLLSKLKQLQQLSSMSATAAAGLSRAATGAGAAPLAAAGGGSAQRGLRTTAVAAMAASSGSMPAILSFQTTPQQQQHQQRRLSAHTPAAPAYASHSQGRAARRHNFSLAVSAAGPGVPQPLAHLAAGPGSSRSAPQLLPRRYAASGAAAQLAAEEAEEGSDEPAVGCLVEFERSSEYVLGLVIKRQGSAWQVEDANGTVYSVKDAAIKFVLPGGPRFSPAELASIASQVRREAGKPGLLEEAWDVATDGGKADLAAAQVFTVPEMADLLFMSAGPAECAAALRALRDDRLYFKQAGRSPPCFAPRTAAQVASLRGQQEQQAREAASWQQFLEEVQQAQRQARRSKPSEAAWRAGPHGERLAAVEAFALGQLPPMDSVRRPLATQTLIGLGKTPSTQDAAELLQSLGWWPPHLQLNLLAANVREQFSDELEALAQQLLASPPADPDAVSRRDFTASHAVMTIDDASTTEIDDGLSLERLPDGSTKVWVHIADPSRWVAPGSPLAEEARRRSKSLYLPTGVVPMFPKCLAEGPFSLRQGVPTEAMSVGVCLAPDGALLPDTLEAVPSLVCPSRRLTYVDADEMLEECQEEDEQDLFDLLKLANLRRQHRLQRGATEIAMPECSVRVGHAELEEPDVSIEEEDQYASPSRQLVAEMMILAGEAVGEAGRRLGVPLPYRGQTDPVLPEEDELASVPPGPCRAVLLRMRMTRSMTLTHGPVRHAGLGLDAYVQFTSPIRRYGDLLAHWQLKAALRGEVPRHSADELLDVVEAVGATAQGLVKLERETEAYWVAEYFRQATKADPDASWGATFLCWLKQEAGLGRVLLHGMGLETVMRINRPVQPGDELWVRCVHTDVKMGMWRLEVAHNAQVGSYSTSTY